MIYTFSSFQVEVKNLRFTRDDGSRVPKTAILSFTIPGQLKPMVEIMGYMEASEIFTIIREGQSLRLDNCYVDHFSLAAYRSSCGLGPKEYVDIKDFSAYQAFFDSRSPIDLSYARFGGKSFSMSLSMVAAGSLSFHSSVFGDMNLDFSGMHYFGGDLDFTNVKTGAGDLIFKNTVFGPGKKDFQYGEFGPGSKIFTNAEFGDGDVAFINTQFGKGDVLFKVTRFGHGKIDFHFAKFGEGEKNFERAEFGNGGIDFRTVEFGSGRVLFNRCIFGAGNTDFEASEMKEGKMVFKAASFAEGRISFELAEMPETELSFERAVFGNGSLSFYNSRFSRISFAACHLDHYTDLRVRSCRFIDLSNTIVRDIIDLKPYEFSEDIEEIDFSGMRLIGRMYIDWQKNKVEKLISTQNHTDLRSKAEQFRTLKENFSTCGQYNDEDKAYLFFKRLESRSDLNDSLKRSRLNALWHYPAYFFKWVIFDKAGHYATNPLRVIITMLLAYTIFSILYALLIYTGNGTINESVNHPGDISVLGIGFYQSAITFLTIGYGDYYPTGVIRWVSGIEGFTGVFLMSYFTVAFVRKILR